MGRKLRTEPVIASPLASRLILVRQQVWKDNQKQMAKDLECDTATVSNMLAGRHGLSLPVLTAMAAFIDINWLLTGKGKQPCASKTES
jgi:hypothetical protein